MKISRKLEISGINFGIASEIVRLSLLAPGRAEFQISATEPVKGLVKFYLGNTLTENDQQPATLHQFFIGYVKRSVPVSANLQSVLAFELTNVLDQPMPLSLRHVTARDVLQAINALTGLVFTLPDEAYSRKKIAYFYNIASGFHAMNELGRAFQIPDYIWQQNGDGTVYAGSHAHSHWVKHPVDLPPSFFSSALSSNRFSCAAIPGLRPGVTLNGQRVTDVVFQKNTMDITCDAK